MKRSGYFSIDNYCCWCFVTETVFNNGVFIGEMNGNKVFNTLDHKSILSRQCWVKQTKN